MKMGIKKPHLYMRDGKWRMTGMPRWKKGASTGMWARANMWVFNKNGGRRRIRRA